MAETFVVTQVVNGIGDTTRYLLVDVSATTWPHPVALTDCIVRRLHVRAARTNAASGNWTIRVGAVVEDDATNGSVNWFYEGQLDIETAIKDTVEFGRDRALGLGTGNSAKAMTSTNDVADSTNWQTDVTLTTPIGTATAPQIGDVVMEIVEVGGTDTLDAVVMVEYQEGRRA